MAPPWSLLFKMASKKIPPYMYENVIYGPSHFCVENSLAWVIHVYAKVPCIMYINLKFKMASEKIPPYMYENVI